MEEMLYTSKMPQVTVTVLPDGKRDVTVLVNEQEIVEQTGNMGVPEDIILPEETEVTAAADVGEAPEEKAPEEKTPAEETLGEAPVEEQPEEPDVNTVYQYDGNQFRTVYDLTEEEILADLDKYLNYDSSKEPTLEQIAHDHELIDSFTLELMEGGLL